MQKHTCDGDPCERCAFIEKVRSIGFGADATPFRREHTVNHQRWAAQQFADDAAYRRLRADGLQPVSTQGAAHLERHADTAEQIEGRPKLWRDRDAIIEDKIPARVS